MRHRRSVTSSSPLSPTECILLTIWPPYHARPPADIAEELLEPHIHTHPSVFRLQIL